MKEETEIEAEKQRPEVGTLVDFVYGVDDDNPLDVEVAVDDVGKVVIFHNKPFKTEIAWLEFELETNMVNFILEDGKIRDIGLPLKEGIAKNMQNSHQILMVLLDDDTGDAKEGNYVPLIIHQT